MERYFIMLLQATKIELTEKQKTILEKLSKGTHVKLNLKIRATLILYAAENMTNGEITRKLNLTMGTVRKWRDKWEEIYAQLLDIENKKPYKLKEYIEKTLSDDYRSGRNATFTPEQVAGIIHLSLQSPESEGVPTASSLARKAIELKIVESISPRQVGRFLKIGPI